MVTADLMQRLPNGRLQLAGRLVRLPVSPQLSLVAGVDELVGQLGGLEVVAGPAEILRHIPVAVGSQDGDGAGRSAAS